jgi:hypothetical protein
VISFSPQAAASWISRCAAAIADEVGGRRRGQEAEGLDEHIGFLVAAESAGKCQPRCRESRQPAANLLLVAIHVAVVNAWSFAARQWHAASLLRGFGGYRRPASDEAGALGDRSRPRTLRISANAW